MLTAVLYRLLLTLNKFQVLLTTTITILQDSHPDLSALQ